MKVDELSKHRMFIGNEPPFLIFEMQYHSLFFVVESLRKNVGGGPVQFRANPAVDIAVIGIVAQFEVYCKHQFAALVNLNGNLVQKFAERRNQASISLTDVAGFLNGGLNNLGAIIAEKYDFGSARNVNALFRDLVDVSPFSKDEAKQFDSILCERHLLVHHGGIQTLEWAKRQRPSKVGFDDQVFRQRIKINEDGYYERSEFLFEMGMKIARSTVKAAKSLEDTSIQDDEIDARYSPLLMGLYDNLE